MTGSEIITLIRNDSLKGHRALFDEYKNFVYTIVYNRLRNIASREDIEECVSDVFTDIIINLERNDVVVNELSGYISVIAKRKAIGYYHNLTDKNLSVKSIDDEMKSETDIVKETEDNDQRRIILRLINELGEPDCSIILMKYYYKRNSSQIAEKLKLKPAAIRKRAERALNKLRKKLSEAGIFDSEEYK